MQNMTMSVEGDELIIRVDLTKSVGPSSTHKSLTIAKTDGRYEPIPGSKNKYVSLSVMEWEKGKSYGAVS